MKIQRIKNNIGCLVTINGYEFETGNYNKFGVLTEVTPHNLILTISESESKRITTTIKLEGIKRFNVVRELQRVQLT